MNLKNIEKEFDKKFLRAEDFGADSYDYMPQIKSFYRTKIRELLKEILKDFGRLKTAQEFGEEILNKIKKL